MKICKGCNREKTIENTNIYTNKYNKTYFHTECKKCKYKRQKIWAANNPDKVRRIQRKGRLKLGFGLSLEQYDSMLKQQNGVCAICCGGPQEDTAFYVDHNHTSGKIRGLLCVNCNLAIGHIKDDPYLALEVAKYLLIDLY